MEDVDLALLAAKLIAIDIEPDADADAVWAWVVAED
jgi:hypothetical protein